MGGPFPRKGSTEADYADEAAAWVSAFGAAAPDPEQKPKPATPPAPAADEPPANAPPAADRPTS